MNRCDACGRGKLVERRGDYTYTWPDSLSAKPTKFRNAVWLECDACGEQVLLPELLSRIEARRYRLEGLLTPDEIRSIREAQGLTQVQMARMIGAGDKTYSRWENGLSVQTKSMDTLIRAAALCPALFTSIEHARELGTPQAALSYPLGTCAIGGPVIFQPCLPLNFADVYGATGMVVGYSAASVQGALSWTAQSPESDRSEDVDLTELTAAA